MVCCCLLVACIVAFWLSFVVRCVSFVVRRCPLLVVGWLVGRCSLFVVRCCVRLVVCCALLSIG